MTATNRTPVGRGRSTRVLYDIAQSLESVEGAEARIDRVFQLLRRLIVFDGCALIESCLQETPRFVILPSCSQSVTNALKTALTDAYRVLREGATRPPGHIAPEVAAVAGWQSYLGAPLIWNGDINGLLFVGRHAAAPFRARDLSLLSVIASQLAGFLGAVRLHEREAAVMQRDRFQAQVLDAVHQAVVAVDQKGRITFWNPAAEEMYGRSAAEVVGRRANARIVSAAFFRSARRRVLAGETWSGEATSHRSDGSEFNAAITAWPFRDSRGDIVGAVALISDVTERAKAGREARERADAIRKANEELARSTLEAREAAERERIAREELQRTQIRARRLFESSLIGMLEADDKKIIEANQAFLSLVGYSREDLAAGKLRWEDLLPADQLPLIQAALAEAAAFGEAPPGEREFVRKDGGFVPVLLGMAALQRSPLRTVSFVLDMSDQKRAQAEIERLRNEFLGIVSHELKTPLTAIKGSASMVLSSRTLPPDEEIRELFGIVDNQAERLRELVGNLLDMSRIEAGTFSVELEETTIEPIIAEIQSTVQRSAQPQRLEVQSPPALPSLLVDRRRVVQVLMNLLNNAAKFSPADSSILLAIEPQESEVLIKVTDFGVGITSDMLPRLFEKFAQFHGRGRGSGLGLAIAKGIVEAHGGRIWVESEGEGKGSTFIFTLPIAAAVREEKVLVPEQFAAREPVERAKILVVEDEPAILRYIGYCLTEGGYEPLLADEPLQVKKLVKSRKPDAILLDQRLPGTSGIELLKELREFSDVPVIFITGSEDPEIERLKSEMAPLDRLGKPFTPGELLEKLAAALGRQPALGKER